MLIIVKGMYVLPECEGGGGGACGKNRSGGKGGA